MVKIDWLKYAFDTAFLALLAVCSINSINVLFKTGIPFNFETFAAAFFLVVCLIRPKGAE